MARTYTPAAQINIRTALAREPLDHRLVLTLLKFPIRIPSRRIPHYGAGGKGGAPNSGTVILDVGPHSRRFSKIFTESGTI
jgi:hypothetical protein